MLIKYNSSVYTQAGWRHVSILASATQISKGMAIVDRVLEINGDSPHGYQSRTGAKRQIYNAGGVGQREIGAKKRLSACDIITDQRAA